MISEKVQLKMVDVLGSAIRYSIVGAIAATMGACTLAWNNVDAAVVATAFAGVSVIIAIATLAVGIMGGAAMFNAGPPESDSDE